MTHTEEVSELVRADSFVDLMSRLERTISHDWPFLDKSHKALHRESLGAINWLTEKLEAAQRALQAQDIKLGEQTVYSKTLQEKLEATEWEIAAKEANRKSARAALELCEGNYERLEQERDAWMERAVDRERTHQELNFRCNLVEQERDALRARTEKATLAATVGSLTVIGYQNALAQVRAALTAHGEGVG